MTGRAHYLIDGLNTMDITKAIRLGDENTRPVRFWPWINNGKVKLTVYPDRNTDWPSVWRHEEGYSYESLKYTFDRNDGMIYFDSRHGGRDCDGPIDFINELSIDIESVERLDMKDETVTRFEVIQQMTNDHVAIEAGY